MKTVEVTNRDEILGDRESPARTLSTALDILETGINAVLPHRLFQKKVNLEDSKLFLADERVNLEKFSKIIVVGGGKASYEMSQALYEVLGDKIDCGLVITNSKTGSDNKVGPIQVRKASHPIPDRSNVQAAEQLLEMAEQAQNGDLVICLISGGGSALMSSPLPPISIEGLQIVNKLLIDSGASINEINTVRKQLSQIKGGKLAETIYPGQIRSLIISDVVADPVGIIASGPTEPFDPSPGEALAIIDRYGLRKKIPDAVFTSLREGKQKGPDSPEAKKNEIFNNVRNHVIGNNLTALRAIEAESRERDLRPLILSSMLEGTSNQVGGVLAQLAKSMRVENLPLSPPAVLIAGGETTVAVDSGGGSGGPNQELVSGAARQIRGLNSTVVAAVDTDGQDGSTEVAGGIVHGELTEAQLVKIHQGLANHNSLSALNSCHCSISTGSTGTNVNDIILVLVS
ncbi:MAG: glycerate kinase [Candidatus Acetothermia bacterium]